MQIQHVLLPYRRNDLIRVSGISANTPTAPMHYAQFTPPARQDKTILSVSYQAVWTESARQVRSASECVRRSHSAARHTPTQNAPVWRSGRLNSHRHIRHDKTVLSLSCLALRCELAFSNTGPTGQTSGIRFGVRDLVKWARARRRRF